MAWYELVLDLFGEGGGASGGTAGDAGAGTTQGSLTGGRTTPQSPAVTALPVATLPAWATNLPQADLLNASRLAQGSLLGDGLPQSASQTAPSGREPLGGRTTPYTGEPFGEKGEGKEDAVDRAAEFERMIKGDYREAYEKRVKAQLDRRFRETENLKKQAAGSKALMELLAGKYGVAADDVDGLLKAAEADESYYEAEAAERGLTVEQLRHVKQLERQNAAYKAAEDERTRQENNQRVQARWLQQAEEAKAIYPKLDFQTEVQNERFCKMLAAGVDVKTAYEAMHMDEIMSGGMQYAAQRAQQQTMDNIRARGMRPREGALGNNPAGDVAFDAGKLTKEQRADFARRAKRGERITFGGG